MAQFCYNRGCQKNFTPLNDPTKDDVACQFHPGLPYFHDAYKIWSCCQKKSHDFNTFLSLPGCQRGPHQPNKPVETAPPRPVEEETTPKPVIRETIPSRSNTTVERPAIDASLVNMKFNVSNSLKAALEKLTPATVTADTLVESANDEIKPDTPCRHATCGARYVNAAQAQITRCRYHPGVPIFHEGMKYWSCCQKKTTDFEAFTAQAGCTEGEHLWRNESNLSTNEDDPQTLKTACRYDFHQQGATVTVSIYAKMPRPDQTTVELNAGRLKVDTRFGTESKTKRFANDWNLFGLIDVEKSTVELLQTKVEIVLRKAEPLNWSRLELPNT